MINYAVYCTAGCTQDLWEFEKKTLVCNLPRSTAQSVTQQQEKTIPRDPSTLGGRDGWTRTSN